MPSTPLTERLTPSRTRDLKIDRERRIVSDVALTGVESKNGYRYTVEALRTAVPLYEGRPVFLDHARQPMRRSARDLVGTVTSPRFENDRVRADITVLDTEAGRTFLALAESAGDAVGMSHVVLAHKSKSGELVERIDEVVSIDAVIFPATAASFGESINDPEPDDDPETVNDPVPDPLDESELDQLLSRSGLPSVAVSECFRNQLRHADAEDRERLIEDRHNLIRLSRSAAITSFEREQTDRATDDDRRFVEIVRRSTR